MAVLSVATWDKLKVVWKVETRAVEWGEEKVERMAVHSADYSVARMADSTVHKWVAN